MRANRYPTWKFRYFRLRWRDCWTVTKGEWEVGVAYCPRCFNGNVHKPFRALSFYVGRYEYVFDLGRAR
jgi:hypothetical protein